MLVFDASQTTNKRNVLVIFLHNPSFNDIYLFIFLFNVFVVYLYSFLGGLPLYGVYDSL